MPNLNVDYSPPSFTFADGIPTSYDYIEQGFVPIFWGDNQFFSGVYTYPSGMTDGEILEVPKVVRFLYTYGDRVNLGALWCKQSDDCQGGGQEPGDPCAGGSLYGGTVSILGPAFGGSGVIDGERFWGFVTSNPGGPIYLTDAAPPGVFVPPGVNRINPCAVTVRITGVVNADLGRPTYFTYYTGNLTGYHPSTADIERYRLPQIYGVACCSDDSGGGGEGGGGSPPVPPVPPVPPGCGDGSDGGGV